uniref:Neurotransmitter-gated ion-channel ligand-binding domain containing protein n=1 Tax=Haemonchus contortus TaxID=6289 RepID=W6NQ53_HAECO
MFVATVTVLIIIYSALLHCCTLHNRTDFLREEALLKKKLLENYDPKLPVIATETDGVDIPRFQVDLALGFLKLKRMYEPEQKVDFIFEYQMDWQDERLTWDPSEHCGIERIYLSREDVWIPEVTVTEAESSQDFREDYKKYLSLNSTGHLIFFVPTVTSVLCSIKVRDFPFDSQTCSIKMMTHSFRATEYGINIVIPPAIEKASPLEDMGNGEWQVKSLTTGTERLEFEDGSIVEIGSFDFFMKRNPAFYLAIVITPSFIINIICILGLFLSGSNKMSQLGMALTNIMSLTFILGILANVLPKVDELPKIGIYVVVNLALITASLLTVLLLPYLPLPSCFRSEVKGEKGDGEETSDEKTFRLNPVNIAFLILFELANLVNFLVLIL